MEEPSKCSGCEGSGWIWNELYQHNPPTKVPCTDCKGSGLTPEITNKVEDKISKYTTEPEKFNVLIEYYDGVYSDISELLPKYDKVLIIDLDKAELDHGLERFYVANRSMGLNVVTIVKNIKPRLAMIQNTDNRMEYNKHK